MVVAALEISAATCQGESTYQLAVMWSIPIGRRASEPTLSPNLGNTRNQISFSRFIMHGNLHTLSTKHDHDPPLLADRHCRITLLCSTSIQDLDSQAKDRSDVSS